MAMGVQNGTINFFKTKQKYQGVGENNQAHLELLSAYFSWVKYFDHRFARGKQ